MSEEYKIESGIEVYPHARARSRFDRWISLINKMKIGDSIVVEDHKTAVSLYAALKDAGCRAAMRQIAGEKTKHRVWKLSRAVLK